MFSNNTLIWTNRDIEYLKNNYLILDKKTLCKKLKRTWAAIRHKASRLKLNKKSWTEEENTILEKLSKNKTAEEISKILNRNTHAIRAQWKKLGVNKNPLKYWNNDEVSYLIANFRSTSYSQLCKHLNRSAESIRWKARQLNLSKISTSSLEKDFFNSMLKENKKIQLETQKRIGKYRVDFLYKNLVIEVNGDYWHANPRKYKIPLKHHDYVIKKDKEKYIYLKSKKYRIAIIWEMDFYKNPKQIIKDIIAVLNSDIKYYNSAKSVDIH